MVEKLATLIARSPVVQKEGSRVLTWLLLAVKHHLKVSRLQTKVRASAPARWCVRNRRLNQECESHLSESSRVFEGIDCLIFVGKHRLDAGRLENFPAVTMRADFNNRAAHINGACSLTSRRQVR